MVKFLVRFRIIIRRIIDRCPRRLRLLGGPLLGGLVGLIGGVPGFLIGLLLGYLLRELFVQSFRNRSICDYFESPGFQRFYEGEPGLAAWCGLAVLVSSADFSREKIDSSPLTSESILKQVILAASCVFTGPAAEPSLMEHFSRLAWSRRESLNPDLLAESLAARYQESRGDSREDLKNLGRALKGLAAGERAKSLVKEIRLILDPSDPWSASEDEPEDSGPENGMDPWKVLGLPPGTPLKEVKALYRRLAKQFHPDELAVLDEKHREIAARAFMAIKEAYQEITDA